MIVIAAWVLKKKTDMRLYVTAIDKLSVLKRQRRAPFRAPYRDCRIRQLDKSEKLLSEILILTNYNHSTEHLY